MEDERRDECNGQCQYCTISEFCTEDEQNCEFKSFCMVYKNCCHTSIDYVCTQKGFWREKKFCTEILKEYGEAIRHIKNPTEEMCWMALSHSGHHLMDIKNPTEEMKLFAVKEDGYNIEYINEPSKEMCLIAVKENGQFIENIHNLNYESCMEEVCMIAIKQNIDNIKYVDVEKYPRVWRYYQLLTV